MDMGDRGKKTSKTLNLFKEESGPSSKRWLRSDSKKSSEKVGTSTGMNSDSCDKKAKAKIDLGEKSADGGAKKRKISTTERETSQKRSHLYETEQGEVSNENSDGDEKKTKIETGKDKKRKLSIEQDRSDGDHSENPDETMAKKNGGQPNFNLPVPGELLVRIFKLVPISQWASLESVSHQFQDVVHGLWGKEHDIRLDELVYDKEKKPHQVVDAVLKKFLLRAPNITSISGFAEFYDRDTSIRLPTIRLLSKFKQLNEIDFSGKRVVTAGIFGKFLESSASRQCWKRLDIVGIYDSMRSYKAVGFKNRPALNLEYLKFSTLTIGIFEAFLRVDWSRLQKLVVIDTFPCAEKVLLLIRQCTQLAHLEVAVPHCWNGNGRTSYADFVQGVADLENLSVLKLVGFWSWDTPFSEALLMLIKNLGRRRITDFALLSCHCNNRILGAILDHLPRLKSLEFDVVHCMRPLLERLANEMGQLETLKLRSFSNFSMVNGDIVRAICGNISNLQCLRLDYPECKSEDYASLADLKMLKELHIRERSMDCQTIETWSRLEFGSHLESLELLLQNGISAQTMGDFLKNMPRLHSITFRGVDDDILKAIGESCPNLVELYIFWGSTVTCTGIQSVIDHCSRLKILNVSGRNEWYPSALTLGKYRKIAFKSESRV